MCAGNHHHRFTQFKITRRNVQVKNTPSSPYMERLFMDMLKLFKQVKRKTVLKIYQHNFQSGKMLLQSQYI